MSAGKFRWLLAGVAFVALSAASSANAAPVNLSSDAAFGLYLKDYTTPAGSVGVNLNNGTGQSDVTGLAGLIEVHFASSVTGGLTSAGGAATISATSAGTYQSLLITTPGYWFQSLEFGIQLPKDNTTFSVQAFFSDGHDTTVVLNSSSDTGGVKANANNKVLALAAEAGTLFTSILLTSSDGINQTKQFYISGLTEIPEDPPGGSTGETPIPGAVLLFGSVLAGGIGVMRRRKNAVAPSA